MNVIEKLGWKVNYNKSPDALPIDIYIGSDKEEVAAIWGELDDPEWTCVHPEEDVEFDEEGCGKCNLCGAECEWRWVKDVVDEGYDGEGQYYATVGETRTIEEWVKPLQMGGVLKEYVEELREQYDGKAV